MGEGLVSVAVMYVLVTAATVGILLGGKQTLMKNMYLCMCVMCAHTHISAYIVILFLCCYQYLMHENQGDGYFCRSLNEKGEEGVAFAPNETTGEGCTCLAASGNEPKVWVFFSWMCCWPLIPSMWLLKALLGQKVLEYTAYVVFWTSF